MTAVVLVQLHVQKGRADRMPCAVRTCVMHAVMLYTLAGARGSLEPNAPLGNSVVRSSTHDAFFHVAHSVRCKGISCPWSHHTTVQSLTNTSTDRNDQYGHRKGARPLPSASAHSPATIHGISAHNS